MVLGKPICHLRTPVKVAFLTGRSNPFSCKLSSAQQQFLESLDLPDAWKVHWNFPYIPDKTRHRKPTLLEASLHNGLQFVLASTPIYRWMAQRHWNALAASAEKVVLITGSCGLQILNCLTGKQSTNENLRVCSVGPVAWRRPLASHMLIRGAKDRISAMFFRDIDVCVPNDGHLDYFLSNKSRELVSQWVCNSILK